MSNNPSRNVTESTKIRLYGLSRNICANPKCHSRLIDTEGNLIGEIAHIRAASPSGPRYDPNMTDDERRNISNLILLCNDCHKKIDDNPEKYTVELLCEWKKQHESVATQEYYIKFEENIRKQIKNNFIYKLPIKITEEDLFENTLFEEKTEITYSKKHVLLDFILDKMKSDEWDDFKNIHLKGIAGIGKSIEMKFAYNAILNEFSDKENFSKYKFCPIPIFRELKNYRREDFITLENSQDNYLLFLDGLDEISDSQTIDFAKWLSNLLLQFPNVRFIVSGRSASFTSEINELTSINNCHKFKLFPNKESDEVKRLTTQYSGTPLESLVSIPFYRIFAQSEKAKDIKNYKDFMDKLVDTSLTTDKKRHDRAKNIGKRNCDKSNISLTEIKNELSTFVFHIFESDKRLFTEDELQKQLGVASASFILKSSLIDYNNENNISFSSNIFYEYFVAKYLISQNFNKVFEVLFIKRIGKINVSRLNILFMMMHLLDENSKLFLRLSSKLKMETFAYILYTDFQILPDEKRFYYYKEIIKEFNSKEKIIYYARFRSSNDLFENIPSLAEKMAELLPEKYYQNAVNMNVTVIEKFLKSPSVERLNGFSNAVILLGVYTNPKWNFECQNEIRKITISLIKFFLNDGLSQNPNIKGLLSADIVFDWYQTYKWTSDWLETDWIDFIKSIIGNTSENITKFYDENDYKLKLTLFRFFYKNPCIRQLLIPLTLKILKSEQIDESASIVPGILDDEFRTSVIHLDNDILYFKYALVDSRVEVKELLQIAYHISANGCIINNVDFGIREIVDVLSKEFLETENQLTMSDVDKVYEIFVNYINCQDGLYLNNLIKYIEKLSDEIKIKLIEKLFDDFRSGKFQNIWTLVYPTYCLLNISMEGKAVELLKSLKSSNLCRMYKELIAQGNVFAKKHPCNGYCKTEYSALFPAQIKKRKHQLAKIQEIKKNKEEMLKHEIDVITDKNKLFSAINEIFEYLDSPNNVLEEDSERMNLIYLEVQNLEERLQYDYEDKIKVPPIFSEFALKILVDFSFNDEKKVNREKLNSTLGSWFVNENHFWRYFFRWYVHLYKKEQTDKFLEANDAIVERIKDSMKKEISELINTHDISYYDDGGNRNWVVPFVYFVSKFYNNRLPYWFDKSKIVNFIAFPAWALLVNSNVHIDGKFNWQDWNSVFEWITVVAGIPEDTLIETAFDIYPKLKSDKSKTQIISFFAERIKSPCKYKKQIIDLIIQESIIEANKDYDDIQNLSTMNLNVLSIFWNTCEENYIERVKDKVKFEEFDFDDKNYTRKAIIEYFCRVADETSKKEIIKRIRSNKAKMTDNQEILLSKLGDENIISKAIDEYIRGKNFNTNLYWNSPLFGNTKSKKLFKKYIKLFFYSLEKDNDRRQAFHGIAINMIKNSVNKKNFYILKNALKKLIKQKKRKHEYFEYIQSFLNEVEQRVFILA